MSPPSRRSRQSHAPDGATQHRGWLDLVEISGPFLSLPVLRQAWPTLDALEKSARESLRREHAIWRDAPDAGQAAWVRWVVAGLLGWGDELRESADELDDLAMDVAEHETRVVPSFALVEPGEDVKPATTRVLGLVCPTGHSPTARVPGSPWAATYVDRMAALCRHQGVELGVVTDGRWWALVWAPKETATGTAVFDAIAWPDAAEREVVRAFSSILARSRFFGVRDEETLPALLQASLGSQEDITEALGSQVREAVELLVAALGREDLAARERAAPSLEGVDAHDVYRGAVSVMMRIVFLLFAEERRLLPADNDLYASTYSAGQLCADLERRALEGSEDDLEYTTVGWHRLLAVFTAVHGGIDHPRLRMHAHDGSLFDPAEYPWLELPIDDRTVLHMLRAVQYVEIGTGRLKERRSLSFRSLGVEEIGYVYEGLLAYDAFRAAEVVVGLAGKRGQEPEVELRELERIAAAHTDLTALGGELSSRFPNTGLGTAPAIAKKMRPLTGAAAEESRRKLLAATQGDAKLADRLTVFYGLLRQDLRELPMVIRPGALYVTDSSRRRNTGTHYTPRELAEEVVVHALEPLVYEPGPLQTAKATEWRLKSSRDILALNVADIAMGSAAFLVASARYLGARLIEAWTREGDERSQAYMISDVQSDEDQVVIDARRQVIEHCLYGVDINPMAVEMAKLSLWLVSMDNTRPFTFLDDRLVEGDSLLGITSIEQLENMHLDPIEGRKLHNEPDLFGWASSMRVQVSEAMHQRQRIAEIEAQDDPIESIELKKMALYDAQAKTGRLSNCADLLVGAGLVACAKTERVSSSTWYFLEAARLSGFDSAGQGEREAREVARRWLSLEQENGQKRTALHWPLVMPEVFAHGGFDAIVGNPPFMGGQKIGVNLGSASREFLVEWVGSGVRGSADLISFFLLRAHELIKRCGQLGLIGTNTLAEGDTREVGLDQVVRASSTIRRAIKSATWPSRSAALDYCVVWISKNELPASADKVLDGAKVSSITSSLTLPARTEGLPHRLLQNSRVSYQGSNILGLGFTLTPDRAASLLESDKSNSDVLSPYLVGQDLNTRPDLSPSRWVINFRDWSRERAAGYPECFDQVLREVKPERDRNNDKNRRELWWRFTRPALDLYKAVDELADFFAITRVSNTLMPLAVPTGIVVSEGIVAFASSDRALLALLSSSVHYLWTKRYSSTFGVGAAIRYAPSDVFETLPLPEFSKSMRDAGSELERVRREYMLKNSVGLTETYNRVFDDSCQTSEIESIRHAHRVVDQIVVLTYGWGDRLEDVGGLDHGFHKIGRETRYTIGPAAQREVLDSLLELNHERYAKEVAQGLHDKKKGGRGKNSRPEQKSMFDD